MRARPVLMTAALLLAGAVGMHELRYLVAFGHEAESELAHHGHGWITYLTPLLCTLAAIGMAAALLRALAAPSGLPRPPAPVWRIWLRATAALLVIYASQELVEGWLAPGHPAGWSGVFGSGGWTAVPLAFGFGGAVTLGLRLHSAAWTTQPVRVDTSFDRFAAVLAEPSLRLTHQRTCRGSLADHRAGRAPPPASV